MKAGGEAFRVQGGYSCKVEGRCDGGVLIGRLRIWNGGGRLYSRERCVLCLTSPSAVVESVSYIGAMGNVAAIICPRRVAEGRMELLGSVHIPLFIICGDETLDVCTEGRLALIDAKRSTLIVDPSFEELERRRESEREEKAAGAKVSFIADKADIAHHIIRGKKQSGGLLCNGDDIASSGDFFELLLALTESMCTDRLCIAQSLPWRCGSDEFEERSESLFRSAVYGGELSVMLFGYRSAREIEEAFELMHRSFCRLEEQGREVSGYLARGVMIDSPIALLEIQQLPEVDFICFDFDRLCEGLLGYPAKMIANDAALINTLCRFWEERKRACLLHRRAELRAVSKRLFSSELLRDWADFMEIREIYTLKPSAEEKNT